MSVHITSQCPGTLKTCVQDDLGKHADHMVKLKAKSAEIQHTKPFPHVLLWGCKLTPAIALTLNAKNA